MEPSSASPRTFTYTYNSSVHLYPVILWSCIILGVHKRQIVGPTHFTNCPPASAARTTFSVMAFFNLLLSLLVNALYVLFILLLVVFLGFCLYIKYTHMKYDHIPGPPRDRYVKKKAFSPLFHLCPAGVVLSGVFLPFSFSLQFPLRTFTNISKNNERRRRTAGQTLGMVTPHFLLKQNNNKRFHGVDHVSVYDQNYTHLKIQLLQLIFRAEIYGPVFRVNVLHFVLVNVTCPDTTKVNRHCTI